MATLGIGADARAQCEIQQFVNPDTPPGGSDSFAATALSKGVAVVGDSRDTGGRGAAFIYQADGFTWQLVTKLTAPQPDLGTGFGRDVDLSADLVVVGAPSIGRAFLYRRSPVSREWLFEADLASPTGDQGDFGRAVAADGDTVIIGARFDSPSGVPNQGAAYVFRFAGGTWSLEGTLADPEPEPDEGLGVAVDLCGDVALVGQPGHRAQQGAALVFRRADGRWVLQQEVTPTDGAGGDGFGTAVALAGHVATISAPNDEAQNGSVHVYSHKGNAWRHVQRLVSAKPVGVAPWLGFSLALDRSGTAFIAGAPFDRELGFDAGAAHVFRETNGTWTEVAKITAANGGPNDQFGFVAMDGDRALIGAPRGSRLSGRVHAFVGLSTVDCNENRLPDACDIFDGRSEDRDGDGVPDECRSRADLDGDGEVGFPDLLILLAQWGECAGPCPPCLGDLTDDCTVGFADLMLLLSEWA